MLTDHLNHRSHCVCEFQKNANGFFRIEEPEVDQLEAAFVVIGSMGVQGARKTRLQLGESGMVTGLGILGAVRGTDAGAQRRTAGDGGGFRREAS